MAKKLKIAAGVVLFFLIVAVGLPFVLPQNTYKNWMIAQVEASLPVDLEVASFRLVFLPFPSIRLDGMKIYSIQDASKKELLAGAESVWAAVALNPLFQRRMQVSLHLQKPVVHLQGVLALKIDRQETQKSGASSWQFEIASFEMDDGRMEDGSYSLQHVDFSLKGLGLAGRSKVPFSLTMGLLGGTKNCQLKGNLKLDADSQKWVGDDLSLKLGNVQALLKGKLDVKKMSAQLDVSAKASGIDAQTLRQGFPEIFASLLRMPEAEMPGLEKVSLQSALQWDTGGLKMEGSFRADALAYKEYIFENVEAQYDFAPPRLHLRSLTASLFGSQSIVTGEIDMGKPLAYQFDVKTDRVNLARLPFLKGVIVGHGRLAANLNGKMAEKQDPAKNLNADGRMEVTEGKIPALKLGEEIFGHSVWNLLTPLAGFNRGALDSLKKLDANVESLDIPFEIRNGVARVLNGRWQNPRYHINVRGDIALNQGLSGGGSFVLPQKETAELIRSEAARKMLANAEGEMVLPFSIGGTLNAPKVTPDKQGLTARFTRAVAARGIEFLKDQLDPEKAAEEPVKGIEEPVKILKDIFGK